MLSTTHVAAGAALGAALRRPAAAAAAGWVSHFIMDALPHWGTEDHEDFLRVARVDGLVMAATFAVTIMASPSRLRPAVAAGMFAAVAPDLSKPVRHFFDLPLYPAAVERLHMRVQSGRELPSRLLREILIAAAAAGAAPAVVRRAR